MTPFSLSRRAVLRQTLLAPLAIPQQLERRPPGKKILVAGAGLAGLTAALELVRAGHDVTVLEAQAREGGRVHTLRDPFSEGVHGEAGAVRIADNHTDVLAYVNEFGLELEPYLGPGDPVWVMQGQRLIERSGKPFEFPVPLRDDERGFTVGELWARYTMPVLAEAAKAPSDPWPPESLRPFDQLNLRGFYVKAGASTAAADLITLGYDVETRSALATLQSELLESLAKKWFRIKGGSDLLPRALAQRLRTRLRYGCALTGVRQDAESVEVTVVGSGGQEQLKADALVVTLPAPLLRQVSFDPGLAADKMELIRTLEMTPASRLFLQTRERFWMKEKLNGVAYVDGLSMRLWPGAPGPEKERGILHTCSEGRASLALDSLPDDARLSAVLSDAERAFPGISKVVEGHAYRSWTADPWQRGAFTGFRPGETARAYAILSRPEGRIYFAGEHASRAPGWMQGAVESGLRAAVDINARPWQPAPAR